MGLIRDLLPLNLAEEREKFFSEFGYNPVFQYRRRFERAELEIWGVPQAHYVDHAKKMLDRFSALVVDVQRPLLSRGEMRFRARELLAELGLKIPFKVVFRKHQVARCSLSDGQISFRASVKLGSRRFRSILAHELETHLLRRENERLQDWDRSIFDRLDLMRTEEGLAMLNGYIFRKDQLMKGAYLNYWATFLAQTQPFRSVYNELVRYGLDQERAFRVATHIKRGIVDTATPGGVTKGIVYLEGAVKVWRWLKNRNHDPKQLYWGRIGLSEIDTLKMVGGKGSLYLPTFFADMEVYRRKVIELGLLNEFNGIADE